MTPSPLYRLSAARNVGLSEMEPSPLYRLSAARINVGLSEMEPRVDEFFWHRALTHEQRFVTHFTESELDGKRGHGYDSRTSESAAECG